MEILRSVIRKAGGKGVTRGDFRAKKGASLRRRKYRAQGREIYEVRFWKSWSLRHRGVRACDQRLAELIRKLSCSHHLRNVVDEIAEIIGGPLQLSALQAPIRLGQVPGPTATSATRATFWRGRFDEAIAQINLARQPGEVVSGSPPVARGAARHSDFRSAALGSTLCGSGSAHRSSVAIYTLKNPQTRNVEC